MTKTTTPDAVICVDMGTTNTRVWIVSRGQIVERVVEPVGLRDAARQRSKSVVPNAIRELLAAACDRATHLDLRVDHALAAGMLTSPLGLCEVPHISAPAGEIELAGSIYKFLDPGVASLPIYLVPGVRSGPSWPSIEELARTDLIRGEETIVVGLLQAGILSPNSTLLNLGSHWKSILIDHECRIASSFTTLSGELIHALQTQTILASALPEGRRLESLNKEWLEHGRKYQAQNGLGRSMFSVRLLEQLFGIDQTALSSFLLGAIVESDYRSMEKSERFKGPVVIAGTGAAAEAWQETLQAASRASEHFGLEVVERAFVRGLIRLFDLYVASGR
jgi:2-dehydro-3-deoxygalactonokinase